MAEVCTPLWPESAHQPAELERRARFFAWPLARAVHVRHLAGPALDLSGHDAAVALVVPGVGDRPDVTKLAARALRRLPATEDLARVRALLATLATPRALPRWPGLAAGDVLVVPRLGVGAAEVARAIDRGLGEGACWRADAGAGAWRRRCAGP